jgi:hypothetical protein
MGMAFSSRISTRPATRISSRHARAARTIKLSGIRTLASSRTSLRRDGVYAAWIRSATEIVWNTVRSS